MAQKIQTKHFFGLSKKVIEENSVRKSIDEIGCGHRDDEPLIQSSPEINMENGDVKHAKVENHREGRTKNRKYVQRNFDRRNERLIQADHRKILIF